MAMKSRAAALRQEIESSLVSRIPAALSPQAGQIARLIPIRNEAVNTLLGGGLPIGGICEFTGPASAGRTSLALSVLSEATVESACAYIDVSDSLDARSAAAAGVRIQNLLWVRFPEMQEQTPNPTQPGHAVKAVAPNRDGADRSDAAPRHSPSAKRDKGHRPGFREDACSKGGNPVQKNGRHPRLSKPKAEPSSRPSRAGRLRAFQRPPCGCVRPVAADRPESCGMRPANVPTRPQ